MYAGSTSISQSHLGYTVPFPKDPKFSQTGKKTPKNQSLGDHPISCWSQVWEKICWSNISLDLHIRTAVLTDKKPYIDILMLGFFDRTIQQFWLHSFYLQTVYWYCHCLSKLCPFTSLFFIVLFCLVFFLVSFFVECERAIKFTAKCEKKKSTRCCLKKIYIFISHLWSTAIFESSKLSSWKAVNF